MAPPPTAALLRPPAAAAQEDGYVDFYGHATASGGWLFCGWAAEPWAEGAGLVAVFERGRIAAEALTLTHDRPDLRGRGRGVVVHLRAAGRPLGELVALEGRRADGTPLRLMPVRPVAQLRETELLARARPLVLGAAGGGAARGRLLALLARRPWSGADTLDELPVPVRLEVDETVLAPPDGLVLMGWLLDPTESVAAIRIRSGALASEPVQTRLLRVPRPDVIEAVGAALGVADPRCGLLAYAPGCVAPGGEALYAEIELRGGEIGYKRIPVPARTGMAAIRRVLEGVPMPAPDEVGPLFDRVLGPPLAAINRARLGRPRPAAEIAFGATPAAPVCSVIVPLYGRMDFLLYQLALLSAHDFAAHELIYVLDDPPRKRELLDLAHSAHRRFGLPFRVIAPEENLGFAPANNLGLAAARGEFVCHLNSDAMPAEPRWLDLMVETLRADPGIGVLGALLLFEDGTVQHEGLTFAPLAQYGGWPFPMHPNKGRRPRADGAAAVETAEGVTGACMLLRRDLAQSLGGFDEAYAIGDFEDSDLCLRIRGRGLRCAVDRRARLWHLERQSQVTPDRLWRHHLTLFNAWTHTRRWFPGGAAGRGNDTP